MVDGTLIPSISQAFTLRRDRFTIENHGIRLMCRLSIHLIAKLLIDYASGDFEVVDMSDTHCFFKLYTTWRKTIRISSSKRSGTGEIKDKCPLYINGL